jgi:hypothetical protein
MKMPFVLFAGALFLSSCYFQRDIQVERVNVELVKIDTVFRSSGSMKVLTWRTDSNLSYFSLEPLEAPQMDIGSTTVMLIKK